MRSMSQNSLYTPEYFVWINKEDELARPSKEGLTRLEDLVVALHLYHEIMPHYLVTTAMHRQLVPGTVNHILSPNEDDDRVIEYI